MSKNLIAGLLSSILFILIILTGCNSTEAQNQTEGGLKINRWDSALGGVNETDLDKTIFSYSIYLTNENEKSILIKSIKPTVNETVKNKILSTEIAVAVNKDLNPNETIQINGEIIIDTKGLEKSEIVNFQPIITDIKVSIEETVNLPR